MPLIVLLAGLALPLLELAVLIKVGQTIGLWQLLLLLLGMAILGAALLYWQGWSTLRQARDALLRGEAPVGPMLDGMLLVAAGVLLLAPGLITDALALALLLPPLRHAIARGLLRRAVTSADVRVETYRAERPPSDAPPSKGPVIEGEFERIDERPTERARRSKQNGQAR